MIWDQIESNWNKLKGNVKERWGRLSDDDVDVVGGNRAALSSKIKDTYGLTEEDAHKEVSDWETMITNVFKSDTDIVKHSGAKPLLDDKG